MKLKNKDVKIPKKSLEMVREAQGFFNFLISCLLSF